MSIQRTRAVSFALTVGALLGGWAAFAQSPAGKTEPADDPAAMADIQDRFRSRLLALRPDLALPF